MHNKKRYTIIFPNLVNAIKQCQHGKTTFKLLEKNAESKFAVAN